MAGNNSIQILRGSNTYDPNTSQEILLDGQPFYSKTTKKLYIGDGTSKICELQGTYIGLNLEAGSGSGSIQQSQVKFNESTVPGSVANGIQSIAFGGTAISSTGEVIDGISNTTTASGDQAFAAGGSSVAGGRWSAAIGYHNQSLQRMCFSAGGDNIVGYTEEEWVANGGEADRYTKQPVGSGAVGMANKVSGIGSFATGLENTLINSNYSAVHGHLNKTSSSFNLIAGQGITVQANSDDTVALGRGHTVAGTDNIVVGYANTVNGATNAVFGYQNSSVGPRHFMTGQLNKILGGFGNATIGVGLEAYGRNNEPGQTIVGRYNVRNVDAVFSVGIGNSDSARKSGLEVLKDGRARVYGIPTESTDLIRKKEHDELAAEFESSIDELAAEFENSIDEVISNKATAQDIRDLMEGYI